MVGVEDFRRILREELDRTWQSGGTGRGALAEELRRELRKAEAVELRDADTGEAFAGKTVESGTLTSGPIEMTEFREATIHFMADTDSATDGLVVEAFTASGNWRPYYVTTYSANTFLTITVDEHFTSLRVKYTPASYPAKVLEGGVVMVP